MVFPTVLLVFVHGPLHCFSGLQEVGKPHHFCLCRYYSRYTYSSHSFGYSFLFSLKVLGVRAIVLGFRVRVRIRGLGDQNYEVEFETIGTVTQNYANFDYSDYFSPRVLATILHKIPSLPALLLPPSYSSSLLLPL